MGFKTVHLILIIIVILGMIMSFYFYRQFLARAITQCPEWDKEIKQLLSQSNYCHSSQECQTVVVAQGCCGRREYMNSTFYQKGALQTVLAKYNKYCSSKDLCSSQDCPTDIVRDVVCQDSVCIEAK